MHNHVTGENMRYLTTKEYKLTSPFQHMVWNNWYVSHSTFFLNHCHVLTWFLQIIESYWLTVVLISLFTKIVIVRLFTVRLICKLDAHLLIKSNFRTMLKLIIMPNYLHCKMLIDIVCLLIKLFINKWICLIISYERFSKNVFLINFLGAMTKIHPR